MYPDSEILIQLYTTVNMKVGLIFKQGILGSINNVVD